MSTGHRGTATWQPQSVKHSLWNPLLHSLQMIFHSAFQSYGDFICFFKQFKVKKVARFISSFKGLYIMNGVVSCCDMAKNTMNWAHTTFGPQRTIIFQVSFRCYHTYSNSVPSSRLLRAGIPPTKVRRHCVANYTITNRYIILFYSNVGINTNKLGTQVPPIEYRWPRSTLVTTTYSYYS